MQQGFLQQVEILVLDFGSQYTQLIARRLREYGVYTEIVPYFEKIDSIRAKNPKGIILSGGPASVYEEGAYKPDSKVFELGIPVLGICYGMQYIAHFFGGSVVRAEAQEFGKAVLEILNLEENLTFSEFSSEKMPQALEALVDLWEDSVRESHDFLEENDILEIRNDVNELLKDSKNTLVATSEDTFLGFLGTNKNYIEMLFVHPKFFRRGVGSALIREAFMRNLKEFDSILVDCNADNPRGLKFYQQLGFKEIGRSAKDSQGRDFTIVHLEVSNEILASHLESHNVLLHNVKQNSIVWMSHADKVDKIPNGFMELAKSGNTHYCAIADFKRKIYALQFHPEVVHSECGGEILRNFAVQICGASTEWNMRNFAENEIEKLRVIVEGESTQNKISRCEWAKDKDKEANKLYEDYHDKEWGVPLHDDNKLFELLVLEAMQAGLSWITILKKREAFRVAFDNFDPKIVANYDEAKIEELMQNEHIIRNRLKIESAIINAKLFLEIQREFGSFDEYIWGFVGGKPIINAFKSLADLPASTPLSDKISEDLKKRGFKFVGSTIMYAYMQSAGIVNDHLTTCFKRHSASGNHSTDFGNFESSQTTTTKSGKETTSKVLCAVSGGVDSSVVAALLYRAIGENLIPVFVDTGLLRKGEREAVEAMFKENLGVPLITADASELFLSRLKGVLDPEKKRKIIGETFIEVFEKEAKKHNQNGEIKFLAQGTLYPDVIESVSVKGPSKTIKSHHNVGGLPEWMKFELIEPLRELFKDEVRALGRELGMPESMLMRHPFPGPGLAIRIMGEVNKKDLDLLREADSIFIDELHKQGYYDKVWQAFCVLLNVKSVGVMGDNRTYDNTICVRAVEALDGMTATFAHLPHDFLESVSNRIINEVEGINRVVYDITSKPPGTIEWE